jgi:hypothetical protein
LDISTGRIYISRDVVFDETCFPFANLYSTAGRRYSSEVLLLPTPSLPRNLAELPRITVANPSNTLFPVGFTSIAAAPLQKIPRAQSSLGSTVVLPPGAGIEADPAPPVIRAVTPSSAPGQSAPASSLPAAAINSTPTHVECRMRARILLRPIWRLPAAPHVPALLLLPRQIPMQMRHLVLLLLP